VFFGRPMTTGSIPSVEQGSHRDALRRVLRHGGRQTLKTGGRIEVFKVDFSEGFAGSPHGDQAWPDPLTAGRVQRIDHTIENDGIDVALAVAFLDGSCAMTLVYNALHATLVYNALHATPVALFDNHLSALDVAVRRGHRGVIVKTCGSGVFRRPLVPQSSAGLSGGHGQRVR
jgi:hypothetical protein